NGIARFPVGHWPLLDPLSKAALVDALGRRSYNTAAAYGPSVERCILMGYVPHERARVGEKLLLEYFGEHYPATIRAVGYRALYDPEHRRMRRETAPTTATRRPAAAAREPIAAQPSTTSGSWT